MNSPVKFLFDTNFDELEDEQQEPIEDVIKRELQAQFSSELEVEKKKSYEEGFLAGEKKAQEEQDQEILKSNEILKKSYEDLQGVMQHLLEKFPENVTQFTKKTREYRSEAAQLAVLMAQKVAQQALVDQPLKRLETVFREHIKYLSAEPKITIEVPEKLSELTQELFDGIAQEIDFDGKLIIEANDDLPIGDWKFEWRTGGVQQTNEKVSEILSDTVLNYIQLTNEDIRDLVPTTSNVSDDIQQNHSRSSDDIEVSK